MSSAIIREVDKLPIVSERPVQMQVLCLGLSRTSTMTMREALRILGYRSYHYREAGLNTSAGKKDMMCWVEALTAKLYGNGKPFGLVEFDKLLGDYSAVADTPCANLYAELVAAYPDAKVVLTTRDPDKWIQSMEVSVLAILSWRIWSILKPLRYLGREGIEASHNVLQLAVSDWTSGHPEDRSALRQGFITHNENVRSVVPKDNLLEFTPKDGWEPLCKFLGKDIPDEPFPHINKGGNAATLMAIGLFIGCVKGIARPAFVVIMAWVAYRWFPRS